ncbi:MAG: NlpC/P60 family protein [Desulfomicrobiaceae bacterium]
MMAGMPLARAWSSGRRGGGWWRGLLLAVVVLVAGCGGRYVPPPAPPPPPSLPSPVERLQAVALAWVGVPYRAGGMDRRGVDCSGLVARIYEEAWGLSLPRRAVDQAEIGSGVAPPWRRPGDLVFFWDGGPHSGILLDPNRFIHASRSRGVMVSELDAYWWPRLRAVRRIFFGPLPGY